MTEEKSCKSRNRNEYCFQNDICQACWDKQEKKYQSFECDCEGITTEDDVKLAIKEGATEEEARWLFDPGYFFEKVYGSKLRWYQKGLLYCTSKRLAARFCRQTGKTLSMMYKIFHFLITNEKKHVMVVVPTEKLVSKIWKEYVFRDFIERSAEIKSSVTSSRMSPSYEVEFCNGSKLTISIANDSTAGTTADWLYADECALIGTEILGKIIMTTGSRKDAVLLYTSTPRGRGNFFYKACMLTPNVNEYHVSGDMVDEMKDMLAGFLQILGETLYLQEVMALFPDVSGGPFNYKGIDLAKCDYRYDQCVRRPGFIYLGGVDWNGPGIGTYFYMLEFNPTLYTFKVVDKQVIASAVWNSLVAKEMLKSLSEKWSPNHWMCDYGYSHSIIEEIRLQSINAPRGSELSKLKHTLDPVNFGSWLEFEDPFDKEIAKKSTKSFIISQVSRLFEPREDINGKLGVNIQFSKYDDELIDSLENFKLLSISDKGMEKYGFAKGDGMEDHALDALSLAIYGVVKNYSDLFKRIFLLSVPLEGREILSPKDNTKSFKLPDGQGVVLLTDNHPKPIYLDDVKDREEEVDTRFISRTFNAHMNKRPISGINNFRRSHSIIKRSR